MASNEDLQKSNVSVLEDGLDKVELQFKRILSGLSELDATSRWGFSEPLTHTSRVNDSLQELVWLASTPAQPRAYEQFELRVMHRLRKRRELYPS